VRSLARVVVRRRKGPDRGDIIEARSAVHMELHERKRSALEVDAAEPHPMAERPATDYYARPDLRDRQGPMHG